MELPADCEPGGLAVPTAEGRIQLPADRPVVAFGDTESGRRTLVETLLSQAVAKGGPVVAVDNDGRLRATLDDRFPDREQVVVAPTGGDVDWNLFAGAAAELETDRTEAEVGSGDRTRFEAIAASVFPQPERRRRSAKVEANRRTLAAALTYLNREAQRAGIEPDNRELVDFFVRFSSREIHDLVSDYDDLAEWVGALDPAGAGTDRGVRRARRTAPEAVATAVRRTLAAALCDGFGGRNGEWSTTDYVAAPGDRVLVLDYPGNRPGRDFAPAYRLLVGEVVRAATVTGRRATVVVGDAGEVPLGPTLHRSAVRQAPVRAVVGAAGVSALDETSLDAERALETVPQTEVYFRTDDPRTAAYGGRGTEGAERLETLGPSEARVRTDGTTRHVQFDPASAASDGT